MTEQADEVPEHDETLAEILATRTTGTPVRIVASKDEYLALLGSLTTANDPPPPSPQGGE